MLKIFLGLSNAIREFIFISHLCLYFTPECSFCSCYPRALLCLLTMAIQIRIRQRCLLPLLFSFSKVQHINFVYLILEALDFLMTPTEPGILNASCYLKPQDPPFLGLYQNTSLGQRSISLGSQQWALCGLNQVI